ncbi:uncharacterized protein TNCV_3002681 [Trichonephila clavipes]|nr:uncharacterized protein TNCV_3002681 [Trichonephila clavipes]
MLCIQYSVAFSQRSSSSRLIEDETFNDSDIINNLMDYEGGQEEPDSLRADKNMQGFSFPTNWKQHVFFTSTITRSWCHSKRVTNPAMAECRMSACMHDRSRWIVSFNYDRLNGQD